MAELTPKQNAFVQHYLECLNATQAAKLAGYGAKSAYSVGCENLKKPEIQRAIDVAMKERAQRTEISQDNVIKEIASIAFAETQLEHINSRDKLKALELLGKHLGMFNGDGGSNIDIEDLTVLADLLKK